MGIMASVGIEKGNPQRILSLGEWGTQHASPRVPRWEHVFTASNILRTNFQNGRGLSGELGQHPDQQVGILNRFDQIRAGQLEEQVGAAPSARRGCSEVPPLRTLMLVSLAWTDPNRSAISFAVTGYTTCITSPLTQALHQREVNRRERH